MSSRFARLSGFWEPHDGQREFLENPARIKILACGRRWGKTDVCAADIVLSFFELPRTKHIVVAPTQDQANLLFDRVVEMLTLLIDKKDFTVRRSPHPKLTYGDHQLMARSGHLPRALRGYEATHIVVDEAAFVAESLVTDVMMPMLATTDGHITLISTPNGRNHFWRFFGLGQAGKHGMWSRHAPSEESPFVSKDFLKMQRDIVAERVFEVEYMAQFLDSQNQLFRTEAIHGCVVAKLPACNGQVAIGIDWGRTQDATAVAVLRRSDEGFALLEAESIRTPSWQLLKDRTEAIIRKYPGALILTDATGNGDPMLEFLQQQVSDYAISGLTFNNRNKTEMAQALQAVLEHRQLSMLSNPDLIRELLYYEMKQTGPGRFTFGAAKGMHDDMVTALMLALRRLQGVGFLPILGQSRDDVLSAIAS